MSMGTADPSEHPVVDAIESFYRNYYRDEIGELAQHYPNEQRSLYVDWNDIYTWDADVANDLLESPDQMLDYFEEALRQYDLPVDITLEDAHVRVTNFGEADTLGPHETRHNHIGNAVGIQGQVSKRTGVSPAIVEAAFECQRCGTMTYIPQGDGYQEPHECQGCERQGPFAVNHDQSEWTDRQLVRITQPPEQTKGGDGEHIDVVLEDDEVNSADPGDRVTVTGKYTVTDADEDTGTFEDQVDGYAVDVEETDYEEIDITPELEEQIIALANGEEGDPFDLLVDSLAPKHRGDEEIKEAIALQMFGGSEIQYPDGTTARGDSHILLLGDPGTGKSSLLRAVENIAPRSTYASGKGASAAGLTAAVTPTDFGGEKWSLEAGALVLANKGVACVDELDKVHEDAVSSLHDALEAQRVNVNKAGINATLPAKTALLAAGNPKYGRFDPYEPIGDQIDLGPTLLSRFDLMFMVSDKPDPEVDEDVSRHMIRSRREAAKLSKGHDEEAEHITPAVEADVLRAWVAYAKQNVMPSIEDDEVEDRLVDFFVGLRTSGADEDNPVPVTFRKLEAVERLAEASARVRLSETVEMQDVERAAHLVTSSLKDVGIDPETGQFDADIVETGRSKSQSDRIKQIKTIIEDLESENKRGAPHEDVIDTAADADISRDKAQDEIQQLKDKGEVYEPSTDYYRVS